MKEKQNYKVLHEKFNFIYALNVNHDFIPRSGYVMYTLGYDDPQHVTVICYVALPNSHTLASFSIFYEIKDQNY